MHGGHGLESKLLRHLIEFLVDAVFPGGGKIELEELVEGFDGFDFLSGGEQGAGVGFEEGAFAGDVADLAEVGAFEGEGEAVTVSPALLTGLALTPFVSSIPRGYVLGLTATGAYSDGSTQDLSAQVSWSVSGPALAVSSTGQLTALDFSAEMLAAVAWGQAETLGEAGGVPPWDFTDAIDAGQTTNGGSASDPQCFWMAPTSKEALDIVRFWARDDGAKLKEATEYPVGWIDCTVEACSAEAGLDLLRARDAAGRIGMGAGPFGQCVVRLTRPPGIQRRLCSEGGQHRRGCHRVIPTLCKIGHPKVIRLIFLRTRVAKHISLRDRASQLLTKLRAVTTQKDAAQDGR